MHFQVNFTIIFLALLVFFDIQCVTHDEQKQGSENALNPQIDTVFSFANVWYCSQFEKAAKPKKGASRSVSGKNKFWPTGAALKVGFLGGTTQQIAQVKQYCVEWSKHANIDFVFPSSGSSTYDLRVSFSPGGGAWSYIGTDAKSIRQSSPTMNLGWVGRDVILHEFGHALGLFHEHQNPKGGICWNEQNVIRELSGPPNNWDEATIRNNVLAKFKDTDVIATNWDKLSIMHYQIPASWVCNGVAIPGGKVLSDIDKEFIKTVYPGRQTIEEVTTISKGDIAKVLKLLKTCQSSVDSISALLNVRSTN
jgi:hypothetical protein